MVTPVTVPGKVFVAKVPSVSIEDVAELVDAEIEAPVQLWVDNFVM